MTNVRKPSDDTPNPATVLAALNEANQAAERLVPAGLWDDTPGQSGINRAGLQALADLLSVLTVQCAVAGDTHAERVMHATGRAALAVLGLLTDMLADVPADPERSRTAIRLLDEAARTARGGGG